MCFRRMVGQSPSGVTNASRGCTVEAGRLAEESVGNYSCSPAHLPTAIIRGNVLVANVMQEMTRYALLTLAEVVLQFGPIGNPTLYTIIFVATGLFLVFVAWFVER